MSYSIKETIYTLQGEGLRTGQTVVLCRFSGCNLWSGREEDRSKAICRFCDTDFLGTDGSGGGIYNSPEELADSIEQSWAGLNNSVKKQVLCTGGEPLLQLDTDLIKALHEYSFEVAVETNGTIPVPDGVDWVCVSPKARTESIVKSGHELKLVYPQKGISPEDFESLDFQYFFLQPMDNPDLQENIKKAVKYCLKNPRWRLSLQVHKLIGIN